MNVAEAARHFQVHRTTILAICKDPVLSVVWGCVMERGEWVIKNPPLSPKWYTIGRVAKKMERSRVLIWKWCKNEIISAIRIGRCYRIPQAELLKLIEIRD